MHITVRDAWQIHLQWQFDKDGYSQEPVWVGCTSALLPKENLTIAGVIKKSLLRSGGGRS